MIEQKDTSLEFVNKIYKYIRNDMPIETFASKFNFTIPEITGIVELCNLYGKNVSIDYDGNAATFKKNITRRAITNKLSIDDSKLNHNQICVVSDTHFGNNHQQLHLLNNIYQEAYNRGIKTVLHVGDLVDGNYPQRKENPRLQFLHNFDEQANYVIDMYPEIDGMTTHYILGSHDETHYKNGGATINNIITRCRNDMKYLGQDVGEFSIDKVKIILDHPGDGKAKSWSYKPQQRIEILESHQKPKILLIGHYHGSYAFSYRNVQCIMVPCLCYKTQFQQKKGISNAVGAYFLDIYSDEKGNIQYFEPEEILFEEKDRWYEAEKDKKKVKKLEIKHGEY